MEIYRHRTFAFFMVFCFATHSGLLLYSAENSLGVVTGIEENYISVEFDSSVYLHPGTMVGIFGGDSIKRHPLTDEVVVKNLEQVAKAQVRGKGGHALEAKITWKNPEVEIKTGMDVIPLINEAAPNSPPILTGTIESIVTPLQSSAQITVPIQDPEGDDVFYIWELSGEDGKTGYLESRITRIPQNTWFAPGIESKVKLTVVATDIYGQMLQSSLDLLTSSLNNDWRTRTLKPFCKYGDNTSANSSMLTRDQRGHWWSVTADSIFSISPGWLHAEQFLVNTPGTPLKPMAIVPENNLIHLLDLNSPMVNVFEYNGILQRSYGINSGGTDIAISKEGVVFIADQSLGGIQVYEPDGPYRACLGRAGEGNDNFSGLKRITLDREGQVFALDRTTNVVHRFGRFQKRLPSWILNLTDGEGGVDLSWHPKGGLLLLLTSGRILRLDREGEVVTAFVESIAGLGIIQPEAAPESIYVDSSGDVFVTYPVDGIIVRYTADGNLYGFRGSPFWELSMFTTDCKGYIYGYHVNANTIFKLDSEGWIVQQIAVDNQKMLRPKTPSKLTVAPDGSMLVVLDSGNINLTQFYLLGSPEPIVFGQPGKNDGQFSMPIDVTMDEMGRSYVLDSKLNRISIFDRNGYFLFKFGQRGKSNDKLRRPASVTVTPDGKTIYIYDNYEIKKYAINHQAKTATHAGNMGDKGRRSGQFLKPAGIACDRQGLLYIADNGRKDLQVIDFRGDNAIVIYTNTFDDWEIEKVTEMMFNVDGKPYLIDSGTIIGLSWE